jgi:signal-transduction protein with cAMP-binding, CBS, and nucleotidyltransferase domain
LHILSPGIPAKEMTMEKLTEILAGKQPHFMRIAPACHIQDALSRMNTQGTDYLIVMDDNEKFLGLLTEHDIFSKSLYGTKSFSSSRVSDVMNTGLPLADSNDSVEQCMRLMKRHHVRYLPVFDEHDFVGVVSADDLLEVVVTRGRTVFDKENETA